MTAKLHAASYDFDSRRQTMCYRYSPKEDLVIPAHGEVKAKARHGKITISERPVAAMTFKPLAFARNWDEVTCKTCAQRRRLWEGGGIPFFLAESA